MRDIVASGSIREIIYRVEFLRLQNRVLDGNHLDFSSGLAARMEETALWTKQLAFAALKKCSAIHAVLPVMMLGSDATRIRNHFALRSAILFHSPLSSPRLEFEIFDLPSQAK